jgi:8-oxo-dGTP pyrophosphatase MutT (NUDIX family)
MKKKKSCGVLCMHGDRVLLMKHADRYDLPKGHTKKGETEAQCAARELLEETGIDIRDVEIDPDFRFEITYHCVYRRKHNTEVEKTVVIFLGRLNHKPDIMITEHIGHEWVGLDFECTSETVTELLEEVREYLNT